MKKDQTFVVRQKVQLTADFTPPDRPRLTFHKGTVGKVTEVLSGKVVIRMEFPHQPPMETTVPTSALQRA